MNELDPAVLDRLAVEYDKVHTAFTSGRILKKTRDSRYARLDKQHRGWWAEYDRQHAWPLVNAVS